MQFMNGLSGTLVDAAYFSAFDSYKNKSAKMTAKMFGYSKNPQGISITNLTKIPIPTEYGTNRLSNYLCIPPLVPNLKMVVGISTLDESMSITMCVEEHLLFKYTNFMETVIEILKSAD